MAKKSETAREIRAPGPDASAEGLRRAYLELLKLTLSDLVATHTDSVFQTFHDSSCYSRTLPEQEVGFMRIEGRDWPARGLTMVGLKRLDDLQLCVESVVADGVAGDLIETGVWRGGASILMRATLDTLGERERVVWAADSFRGFPTPDEERFPEDRDLGKLSFIDFLSVPLEEVQDHFRRLGVEEGVRFVPGFFEDTLPELAGRTWAVVRLDGDSYESTRIGLESLYAGLSVGGYLIIDDYGFVPECERAVREFREAHRISEPIVTVDYACSRWRKESQPAGLEPPPRRIAPRPPVERPPTRRAGAALPTVREVELEHELAELRGRLAELEAELAGDEATRKR